MAELIKHDYTTFSRSLNISERCIVMIELFPGEEEETLCGATQTLLIMSLNRSRISLPLIPPLRDVSSSEGPC